MFILTLVYIFGNTMDCDVKTRTDKKGRDKQRDNVYTSRHIRSVENRLAKPAKLSAK